MHDGQQMDGQWMARRTTQNMMLSTYYCCWRHKKQTIWNKVFFSLLTYCKKIVDEHLSTKLLQYSKLYEVLLIKITIKLCISNADNDNGHWQRGCLHRQHKRILLRSTKTYYMYYMSVLQGLINNNNQHYLPMNRQTNTKIERKKRKRNNKQRTSNRIKHQSQLNSLYSNNDNSYHFLW